MRGKGRSRSSRSISPEERHSGFNVPARRPKEGEAAFVDSGAWLALAWKDAIYGRGTAKSLSCELRGLDPSPEYLRRRDLHKRSAADATSFAIMRRARIRLAFAFGRRFAMVWFRLVA